MHHAAVWGKVEMVLELLAAGASKEAKDVREWNRKNAHCVCDWLRLCRVGISPAAKRAAKQNGRRGHEKKWSDSS